MASLWVWRLHKSGKKETVMSEIAQTILNSEPCTMYVAGAISNKVRIYIHVWGMFPTSGWTNPELVFRHPRPGSDPAQQVVYAELDFFADPPVAGTIILDVLTPLLCEAIIELPAIVHGIRVNGRANHQESFVRFATSPKNHNSDDFIPIPWVFGNGGVDLGG